MSISVWIFQKFLDWGFGYLFFQILQACNCKNLCSMHLFCQNATTCGYKKLNSFRFLCHTLQACKHKDWCSITPPPFFSYSTGLRLRVYVLQTWRGQNIVTAFDHANWKEWCVSSPIGKPISNSPLAEFPQNYFRQINPLLRESNG